MGGCFPPARSKPPFSGWFGPTICPTLSANTFPQWAVHDGVGRVDFAYPHERLLVEVDGRRWHSRDQAFDHDRRRDQEAVMAGWRVLRFTWRQVSQQPTEVAHAVRTVLRRVA